MFAHKALAGADRQGAAQKPIAIDVRPWTDAEAIGRVVVSQDGLPAFVPASTALWRTALGRCVGKDVRVRLIRPKLRRTPEQNAYLWGVVYPDILVGLRTLAESVGERAVFTDEDELHQAMKWAFLRKTYVLPGAGNVEAMPRSSMLSTGEFSEYVDKVKRWAGERGIYVRAPGER